MARRGRPTDELVLSDEERETLERWARRPKSAQALALRCRIVLECAKGATNLEVAGRLGVTRATVGKWRQRFVERRLDGLHDEPRPGAPRTVSDDDVERLIVTTLEETPGDATHWSTRSMSTATGMSASTVGRIWRAFGLKPHLVDSFKLSPDPLFIEKVRDIVGLYLNPPEGALVLCVDEKSQIQALDRTAPVLPLRPGLPRAGDPRLSPARHDQPLRGARCRFGQGHHRHDRPSPGPRVPALPESDQQIGARGPRRARDRRQLLDPQDPRDPPVAAAPPTLPAALHSDLQLVAEPGRALVRRTHHQVAAPGHASVDKGT